MTKTLSNKIRLGSLVATYMVILRHSSNIRAFFGNDSIAPFYLLKIEEFVCVATDIAVPYFFLISGYFFFKRNYYISSEYMTMIEKKSNTLLLPFVLWNVVGLLWLLVFKPDLVGATPTEWFRNLAISQWYGALWYVRDLMIMMLFAPLYQWSLISKDKYRQWLLFVICLGLFLWWRPVDCDLLSTEGCFFFFIGGIVSSHEKWIEYKFCIAQYLILLIFWLCLYLFGIHESLFWYKAHILVGVVILWQSLQMVQCKSESFFMSIAPMAFFVYVTHFYIIKGMKVATASIWPENSCVALFAFLIYPIITFMVLVGAGIIWKRYFPKSFSIATGGRC